MTFSVRVYTNFFPNFVSTCGLNGFVELEFWHEIQFDFDLPLLFPSQLDYLSGILLIFSLFNSWSKKQIRKYKEGSSSSLKSP